MAQPKDRSKAITGRPFVDDQDNPVWPDDDFKRAEGPYALSAAELAAFPRTAAKLGRPASEHPKLAVKLRLDPDILAAFKADGPGWQTRINAALRQALAKKGAAA